MSNQIRGTTTNMTKLVAWDIDLYQSMDTEENCLIWLSQQDKYLLGNALRQMKWRTRWTSEQGTPQPDRDLIAENLAYKLSQEYCVDICQLIIDCIDDENSGVADTINNIIRPNTQQDSRDYGQSQSGTLLGDGNNTLCNLDVWYGGILNLVEQLNTNNEDALQVFEVVTNINELFADVVGSITGIDESSIDAVLQWITFIQQSIMENYVAQWTTTYRDAVVCDLFCMVTDTCELTPTMLYDYFLGRLNGQLQYESLLDQTLNFLFTGLWTGTEIVDVMMLSQIGFRAQLGKWFDFIGFNSIDVDLRLGFNDPSNDWQLLCQTCPTCVSYGFLISQNTFVPANLGGPYEPRALYTSGVGFGANPDQLRGQVIIEKFFVGTISSVRIKLDTNATEYAAGSGVWWYRIDNQVSVSQSALGISEYTFSFAQQNVATRVACGYIYHSIFGQIYPLAPQSIIEVEFCE